MDKQEFRKKLGRKIKVRRVEMDLNQTELATRTGIAQSQLSDVERGIRSLYVEQLVAIAQALDYPVSYLVGEEGQRAA